MSKHTDEDIPDAESQPQVAIDLSKAGEDHGNEASQLEQLLEGDD